MGAVKILIFCTDDDFKDINISLLMRESIDVIIAGSPEEALATIKENQDLDVVILGFENTDPCNMDILKAIKTINPLIEVVMISSGPTLDSIIMGMKLGACDYLVKPIDPDRLIEKIAEAAAQKASHEEKIIHARIKEFCSLSSD